MSESRRKGVVGVTSGEWLSLDDLAQSLVKGKQPATEVLPEPTEADAQVAATRSDISIRGKLPTLDEEQDGRITLDQIDPFIAQVSSVPAEPIKRTNRPAGGEEELQALDDKVSGESVNLMHCMNALQQLSIKMATRELVPNQASIAKRYFLLGFPSIEGDKDEMVMRTRVFDQEDLKDEFEDINLDLYRLPAFKDDKSTVITREDRINLVKALTAFYAAYMGEQLEGLGVDYLKALDSINKFEFKPVAVDKNKPILALSNETLKTFALRLKKFFFEKATNPKRPASVIPAQTATVAEPKKESVSEIEELFASLEAERIIKGLKDIGHDLKRMLEVEKLDRDVAVKLIKDILEDGPIDVAEYMKVFKLQRFDASALLRRVFEYRLPVSAMEIEQHYVFMILGEFLINSANLSEKDFKRFVAHLVEKRKSN